MKYKAIIFDLDGTLLNTITDITNSLNYALGKCGLKEITEHDAMYFTGSGVDVLIKRTLAKYPKDVIELNEEKVSKLYCEHYEKNKSSYTKPYDGMIDTLHQLRNNGFKLAVLSNKPHSDTVQVVEHYFPGLFDVVRGAVNDVPIKPSPQGVFKILDELNLSPDEVYYLGDTNVDMQTALSSGCFPIGATYGFRTKEELIEAKAKVLIDSPLQLLNIVGIK